jgi:peptidoglycan hydrolase CwlO-like protein
MLEAPQVPTRAQLESQLTQLVLQRGQLKDQIENIDKQVPTVSALIQLLAAQEAAAEAEAKAEAEAAAEAAAESEIEIEAQSSAEVAEAVSAAIGTFEDSNED